MSLLFFIIRISLLGGLFFYVGKRLLVDTEIPAPWRKRLLLLFALCCLSVPFTILSRYFSATVGQTLGWVSFFWMAIAGLMMLGLLVVDILVLLFTGSHLLHKRIRAKSPPPPATNSDLAHANTQALSRRRFLRRITSGGVALSASTLSARGAVKTLQTPPVITQPIALRRLPTSMDGFSILQISDLHIGNTIGEAYVSAVVDAVNAAKPDLIVMTGDMVDGSVEGLRSHAAPLARLQAVHGVYFTTGNHEYYSGVEPWLVHLRELGIRVLRNERVRIGDEQHSFDLAGIDDYGAGRWAGHGPDIASALAGRDDSRELVLLAHQPRQVHEAKKYGVGLQLSGHTHGGQIWPWHYLVKAQQGGLLAGLSVHEETQLYISSGTGYWGPPVRILSRSEITRIVLRATPDSTAPAHVPG
ncbi:MAG: metallophosphoesterase [Kofleriaceae bacterium]|nr:metallophosphoesterase [Kofleriaceae bacterium]